MNEFPANFGNGQEPDPEAIRRFFEQTLGQSLPEGMLENMDLSALAGMAGLPSDPGALQAMAMQLQAMFQAGEGKPVNWDLTRDTARKMISAAGDPTPGPNQVRKYEDALRVAEMWVQEWTDLSAVPASPRAWSRSQWVEATLPRWSRMIEPVAENLVRAMGDSMQSQLGAFGAADEMPAGFNPKDMITQMGGTMMGAQFGQALAMLAKEVLSGTEIGVPLLEPHMTALVVNNVAEFATGLNLDESEVVHYLAAREAARSVLFDSVPWLAGHMFGAVEAYARNIAIDMTAMEEFVRDIDMSNPESLQQLPNNMFAVQQSPAQESALTRLSTALALIEGWVEVVSEDAVRGKLPNVVALQETMRRRRATGGPAEHTFAALCGLELRPRLLRQAAQYWRTIGDTKGLEGRDAVWGHPDLLPEADDLGLESLTAITGGDSTQPNTNPNTQPGTDSPAQIDYYADAPKPPAGIDYEAAPPVATSQTEITLPDAPSQATGDTAAPGSFFDANFDDALAALLRGEGDENAPREDGKGGILPAAGETPPEPDDKGTPTA